MLNPRIAILAAAGILLFGSPILAQGYAEPEVTRLWSQGADLYAQGKFAEGAALFEKILPSAERVFGKNDESTGNILSHLHHCYRELGQYDRALPLCERTLRIYEGKYGPQHPEVANCLNNLAVLHFQMLRYSKAEPILERSLRIYEASEAAPLRLAATFRNAARVYLALGEYAKAKPLLVRSLQICEAQPSKQHRELADAVSDLALFYLESGNFVQAERLWIRCRQIKEANYRHDHPEVALALQNLGVLYMKMGQFDKAEPLCVKAVRILEASQGPYRLQLPNAVNNLGVLYDEMERSTEAESAYVRSRELAELSKDHLLVATALSNLATSHMHRKEYAKAGPFLQKSLEIREAKLGSRHPEVAVSLGHLGVWHLRMNQFAQAEAPLQRGLAIYQARLGRDHPSVARTHHNLAVCNANRKQWTKAVAHFQQSRESTARHLATVLPVLNEKEQMALLGKDFHIAFHKALSLALPAAKEAGAASAEWLLNGKALTHQSLAEQQVLARNVGDPKAKRIITDLQRTRARLAALINVTPASGSEANYQHEMGTLKITEDDLTQKLARAVGRRSPAGSWVRLEELRAKLGARTAFVDIARFDVFDFGANESTGPRYVAWITPAEGDVHVIDLGDAEMIDKLVDQARKALIDSSTTITKVGDVEALDALQKPLSDLSAKVLHPLLPTLAKFEEWIVCPDGALWLTPWNALLLPGGEFAVEKYLIRHVVTGRDLVLELPKATSETAYVFADPDYDLAPGKVLAAAGRSDTRSPRLLGQKLPGSIDKRNYSFEFLDNEVIFREAGGKNAILDRGTWKQEGNILIMQTKVTSLAGTIKASEIVGQRARRNADRTIAHDNFRIELPAANPDEVRSAGSVRGTLPRVQRLPGTAREAAAIRTKLKQWLGQEPKVLLDDKASEANIKTVKNPRILTLATHGYFLPKQELATKNRPGLELGEGQRSVALLDKKGQPIENPLLRCGLLLAGCNKRADAKPGEDDGILTGLEIVGMDLNGCELVVLSACETGLGDVRSGEGVAGLRQAFQLAGAKAVLASLWQVPDHDTALLMNAFYGELANGRSEAQALRQAQLERIASRREQRAAAHPFFWAAFALTSRGSN